MFTKAARTASPLARLPRQTAPLLHRARALSSSPALRQQNEEITRPAIETPLSLWNFTEEENMLRETGQLAVNARRVFRADEDQ